MLAGDNLHPVAAAEEVVETHALDRMGLKRAGAINACQLAVPLGRRVRLWEHRTLHGTLDGDFWNIGVRR